MLHRDENVSDVARMRCCARSSVARGITLPTAPVFLESVVQAARRCQPVKHGSPFLLLLAGYDRACPAAGGWCTRQPMPAWQAPLLTAFSSFFCGSPCPVLAVDGFRHRGVIRVSRARR